MRPGFEDQAAGLRRLLHRAPPQVLSVVCCGPQAVSWIAAQAKLKAGQGSSVVAFDELDSCGNLADALGVAPRFDLLQAVEHEVPLDAARIAVSRDLSLLSSARLSRALPGADRRFAGRLADVCRRLQLGADLWLVHSRPGAGSGLSALAMAAHRMMVVVEGNARSVSEAYALLKQIRGPWPQVDLAVAAGQEGGAETLIASLIDVVQRNTRLAIREVGGLDPCLAAASAVVGRRDERYLERVMVIAQRAPMALSV